jgi:hypothetical protein
MIATQVRASIQEILGSMKATMRGALHGSCGLSP